MIKHSRRKLEVKLPTIWTDEKQRWKGSERRERLEERSVEEKRVRRKKMQMREKVGKSRNTVFFPMFCGSGGSKVGSLKRRVRSQLARWEMKNCTPLWREAHFQVKMYKTHQLRTIFTSWDVEKVHGVVARSTFPVKMYKAHHCRTTFGSCNVEKVHAVVARSTFPSQNVQRAPASDHFLLVEMLKKCTTVVARSTFPSQNVKNTRVSDHFWRFRCRKSAHRCGAKHISKSTC